MYDLSTRKLTKYTYFLIHKLAKLSRSVLLFRFIMFSKRYYYGIHTRVWVGVYVYTGDLRKAADNEIKVLEKGHNYGEIQPFIVKL